MTYWRIGRYIAGELDAIGEEKYGSKIVSILSRQLTWSHFVELSVIPQMTIIFALGFVNFLLNIHLGFIRITRCFPLGFIKKCYICSRNNKTVRQCI